MTLGNIDHICFTVDNLEKAEKYLTNLGFKPLRRFENKGSITSELTSPPGDFVLQLNLGTEEKLKSLRERALEWSLYFDHIAFKVKDINKEFNELKSRGVSFNNVAPKYNTDTHRTLASALDEDGRHWIQLSEKDVGNNGKEK
jgi:catechol 2,3-dioxygenase-like lactoylglutathione lyase family enzyme